MKKLYKTLTLILILFSSQENAFAQTNWTWQMPKQFQHYLSDIVYFDEQTFYLSGRQGDFWRTTDGGAQYASAKIPNEIGGTSLFFIDKDKGWAASSEGAVYYTSDAGASWTKQMQDLTGSTLSSIHFSTDKIGYVAGDAGYVDNVLYKTTDGGANWLQVNNLPVRAGADFAGFFFVQAFGTDTVHAVSWNDLVYSSFDGGTTWDTTDIDPAQNASYHEGAYFSDGLHGWVVGPHQSIVHTKDGGKTWANQIGHPDSVQYFSEVFFLDSQVGWASSFDPTGCLFKTTDGGRSWIKSCGQYGVGRKTALRFLDASNGIATDGSGLYLTKDGGSSFSEINHHYGESFNAASFTSKDQAVAVSSGGEVFSTSNGGSTWTKAQSSRRFRPLNGVTMISPTTGFAVGDSGYVVKTTDGGFNWTKLPNLVKINLRSISYLKGSQTLMIVGDSNQILKSSDAGLNWASQTLKTSQRLNAVQVLSETRAVAVGATGYIALSDATGNWTKVTSNTLRPLNDVFFVNALTGFAVGGSGTILKTNDGGQTWVPLVSGMSATLNSVYFVDENTGWAAGGSVLFTRDGGATWSVDEGFLSGNSVRDVYFHDAHNGWAFTGYGGILKYESMTTGLQEGNDLDRNVLTLYPSPANDWLQVANSTSATHKLIIQTLDGHVLKELSGSYKFDVSDLKAGLYIAYLKDGDKSMAIKLIKE